MHMEGGITLSSVSCMMALVFGHFSSLSVYPIISFDYLVVK